MLQNHSLAKFDDWEPAVPRNRRPRTNPSLTNTLAERRITLETLPQRNQFAIELFQKGLDVRGVGAGSFDRRTERGPRAATALVGQDLPSVPPDASAPIIELNPYRFRGGSQDGCR